MHRDGKLLWKSHDFAKDLPKKENLGSKFCGRRFLVGNTVMFKNSLADFDIDRERKDFRDQFLALNVNTSLG